MPPFRQPTPSPPPPPLPLPAPAAFGSVISSSGNEVGGAPSGGAGFEIEIPPNFVNPPPPREVASGVANLGNTCYMNAALQALAHAPELCHALDAESHLRRCPVALRNERRRRRRAREDAAAREALVSEGVGGDSVASDEGGMADEELVGEDDRRLEGENKSKKSHRRSNSSSSNGSNDSKGKKRKDKDVCDGNGNPSGFDPDYEFCTLCEVERLLGRVHSRPEEVLDDPLKMGSGAGAEKGRIIEEGNLNNYLPSPPPLSYQDGPVVPEAFVSGFMSKVAPWFRRGVQEDSHEFLRLLIDAMQSSCKSARVSNPRDASVDAADNEYPFRLFRGTVESNVKCSSCRHASCKIDPIEDVGLDILPLRTNGNPLSSSTRVVGNYGSSMSSSRSASPTSNLALADVQQALERFISSEHLDSGYKCEKCGKLGKATKTSRLASIPPILTLHLKRFRYGSGGVGSRPGRGGGGIYEGGGSTRGSRTSRGNPQPDFDHVGPSGSAKIEGHVRFDAILDVKPYLTPHLQKTVFPKAICRLFAVVCHTGKNSHSGHYVAYVHNVSKRNEWWRMDDAKVVRVSWAEVQNAEAYMLFYRVTSHPVAMELKGIADRKEEKAKRVIEEMRRKEEAAKVAEEAKKAEAAKAAEAVAAALHVLSEKGPSEDQVPDITRSSDAEESPPPPSPSTLGKRARPALASGEEWARAATCLSPEYLPLLLRIQDFIAENVAFSPEFFGYITEEYHRMSGWGSGIGRRVKERKRIKSLIGKGPGGVYPPEDVQGGAADLHSGILDLLHQISIMYKQTSGDGNFLLSKIEEASGDESIKDTTKSKIVQTTEIAPEIMPSLAIDNELIVPADNTESYDGAL